MARFVFIGQWQGCSITTERYVISDRISHPTEIVSLIADLGWLWCLCFELFCVLTFHIFCVYIPSHFCGSCDVKWDKWIMGQILFQFVFVFEFVLNWELVAVSWWTFSFTKPCIFFWCVMHSTSWAWIQKHHNVLSCRCSVLTFIWTENSLWACIFCIPLMEGKPVMWMQYECKCAANPVMIDLPASQQECAAAGDIDMCLKWEMSVFIDFFVMAFKSCLSFKGCLSSQTSVYDVPFLLLLICSVHSLYDPRHRWMHVHIHAHSWIIRKFHYSLFHCL